MTTYDDAATIRAYLDHDAWCASLTDDQRDTLAGRRQILGSLDETHGLNRHERQTDRGTIDALACTLNALPFVPLAAAHWLGWTWAGVLCGLLAVTALVVCCCVQAGRSEGWER